MFKTLLIMMFKILVIIDLERAEFGKDEFSGLYVVPFDIKLCPQLARVDLI